VTDGAEWFVTAVAAWFAPVVSCRADLGALGAVETRRTRVGIPRAGRRARSPRGYSAGPTTSHRPRRNFKSVGRTPMQARVVLQRVREHFSTREGLTRPGFAKPWTSVGQHRSFSRDGPQASQGCDRRSLGDGPGGHHRRQATQRIRVPALEMRRLRPCLALQTARKSPRSSNQASR
jgi:hypothetical protein